jgi:hypothetical protein
VSLGPEELKVTVGWKDGQMLSFGAGRARENRSDRKVRRQVHLGWNTRSDPGVTPCEETHECSGMLARSIKNASSDREG